ncbi:MAG TPA: S8 family serine peptidase, partial [Blastocatellia bacterium]
MAEGVSSQVETARYGAMPGFSQLEPEPLWTQSTGDSKICVAVIDGPVDLSHPCFQGANLSVVETLVPNVVDDGLASLHGTHIASIIFGRHSGPVRGVAPDCRGLIIPVYKSGTRDALHPCSQLDLARAITQAVGNGANVINISGGQLDPSGQAHPLLAHAVRICADSGVLIVAAAGNDGCACLHIPASEPSVLVVGAMDSNGAPMDFSNWGNKYAGRGILAPGENILGAVPGGGTALQTGTSFAAPIVSGIVALLLSIQIKRGQNPDARAACKAILDSAIGCSSQPVPDCSRLLAGRLNAVGAVAHLNEGGKVEMSEQIKETADPSNGAEEIDAHRSPGVEPIGLQCRSSVSAAAAAVQPALSAPGIIPAELPSGGPGRTQVPPAPLAYAPGGITSSGGCG